MTKKEIAAKAARNREIQARMSAIYLKMEKEKDYEIICKLMMTSMMGECARAFERLPILLHADVLRNILYSGVWSRYELIQLKKKKRKKS